MRQPTETQITARERIQWLHHEAGIPIAELARRIGVMYPVVSRWVNEHNYPSAMAADRIARVYQDEVSRRQEN